MNDLCDWVRNMDGCEFRETVHGYRGRIDANTSFSDSSYNMEHIGTEAVQR